MLRHISVRNVALIRELELDFEQGLTVLTGETGAGKSLIVDALSFILGAKADKTMVSYGADKSTVEAVFNVRSEAESRLNELGYEIEDGEILITRTLTAEGRSDIRINGRTVTLSVLKNLTANLADIHGQHEHQSLLHPDTHVKLLDAFGGKEIAEAKAPLQALVAEFHDVVKQLNAIGGSDAERARAEDMLRFQIDEIEAARLDADEEEELAQKYFIASNAEKLSEGLATALRCLNGNGDSLSELAHASSAIADLERFDDRFGSLATRVNSAYLELDDVFQDLDSYLEEHTVDPHEIDGIIDRMEDYKRLKRKYGATIEDVLKFLDRARKKYSDLVNSAQLREKLLDTQDKLTAAYQQQAELLTNVRRQKAQILEKMVLNELTDLGMGSSEFECRIESLQDAVPHNNGVDQVEFYLSTNKGEPPKPLTKVISGGEMSRFMLALKVIAANTDGIDTIVFDEIDTGISGKVGEAIAQKMARLSRSHQILCISHLPAIAAMADQHLKIQKLEISEKTVTTVEPLKRDQMIAEISRLVGGSDVSSHSISHSEELKNWSERYKQSLK